MQNLVFLIGCLGGFGIMVWAMMTERSRDLKERSKAKDEFSKRLNN
jgi:hypothetical protein